MLKAYIKYRRKRVNAHGIHSPFVFEFYNEVLKKAKKRNFDNIEELRKELLKNNSQLNITDFGAGSKTNKTNVRKIKEITKTASIPKKYGKLLARLVAFYKLNNSLELGTSMGLASAYLSKGTENNKVTSIEGCPQIAETAKNNLKKLGVNSVTIKVGEFDEQLRQLDSAAVYDIIFIDGNHKFEPTLNYFQFALNHSHDQSFIIFDDIHWSEEMERVWREICNSNQVNVSIDMFRLGIVCKRKGQRKEHFILKY